MPSSLRIFLGGDSTTPAGQRLEPDTCHDLCRRAVACGAEAARVWTERRWRRLVQAPVGLMRQWYTEASRLYVYREGGVVDIPVSDAPSADAALSRTLNAAGPQPNRLDLPAVNVAPLPVGEVAPPVSGWSPPEPLLAAIASCPLNVPGVHTVVQVFEDQQFVEIADHSGGRISQLRSRGFIYVDAVSAGLPDLAVSRRAAYVPGASVPEMAQLLPSVVEEALRAIKRAQGRRGVYAACARRLFMLPCAGQFLHEIIGHAFETLAQARRHPLFRIGERVSAPGLSVWDDATLDSGFASRRFDDLGLPARRIALLDRGVVMPGYSDPSGTIVRADRCAPLRARMSNLVVKPGRHTRRELLQEVGDGILVEHLAKAAFRPNTGQFQVLVSEAWRVAGGEAVEMLAPFVVTGTARMALARLVALDDGVADDPSYCITRAGAVPTSVRQPMLVFDGLPLGRPNVNAPSCRQA